MEQITLARSAFVMSDLYMRRVRFQKIGTSRPRGPARFGRAWFQARQVDWVVIAEREWRERYSQLRKSVAGLRYDLQYQRRVLIGWRKTPVTHRPRWAIQRITDYYVTKALLRRRTRELRRLVRGMRLVN